MSDPLSPLVATSEEIAGMPKYNWRDHPQQYPKWQFRRIRSAVCLTQGCNEPNEIQGRCRGHFNESAAQRARLRNARASKLEADLKWMTDRADHYKRRWLFAHNKLQAIQKKLNAPDPNIHNQ